MLTLKNLMCCSSNTEVDDTDMPKMRQNRPTGARTTPHWSRSSECQSASSTYCDSSPANVVARYNHKTAQSVNHVNRTLNQHDAATKINSISQSDNNGIRPNPSESESCRSWLQIQREFVNAKNFDLKMPFAVLLTVKASSESELAKSVETGTWNIKPRDVAVLSLTFSRGPLLMAFMFEKQFKGIALTKKRPENFNNSWSCPVKWIYVKDILFTHMRPITGKYGYVDMAEVSPVETFLREYHAYPGRYPPVQHILKMTSAPVDRIRQPAKPYDSTIYSEDYLPSSQGRQSSPERQNRYNQPLYHTVDARQNNTETNFPQQTTGIPKLHDPRWQQPDPTITHSRNEHLPDYDGGNNRSQPAALYKGSTAPVLYKSQEPPNSWLRHQGDHSGKLIRPSWDPQLSEISICLPAGVAEGTYNWSMLTSNRSPTPEIAEMRPVVVDFKRQRQPGHPTYHSQVSSRAPIQSFDAYAPYMSSTRSSDATEVISNCHLFVVETSNGVIFDNVGNNEFIYARMPGNEDPEYYYNCCHCPVYFTFQEKQYMHTLQYCGIAKVLKTLQYSGLCYVKVVLSFLSSKVVSFHSVAQETELVSFSPRMHRVTRHSDVTKLLQAFGPDIAEIAGRHSCSANKKDCYVRKDESLKYGGQQDLDGSEEWFIAKQGKRQVDNSIFRENSTNKIYQHDEEFYHDNMQPLATAASERKIKIVAGMYPNDKYSVKLEDDILDSSYRFDSKNHQFSPWRNSGSSIDTAADINQRLLSKDKLSREYCKEIEETRNHNSIPSLNDNHHTPRQKTPIAVTRYTDDEKWERETSKLAVRTDVKFDQHRSTKVISQNLRLREQQEREGAKQRLIEQQQREDEKQCLREQQQREAEKQHQRKLQQCEAEKQRLIGQQEREDNKQRLRKLQEREAEKQHLREQQECEAERQRLRERQEREAEKQRLREQQEREGAKQRLIEQQQREDEKQRLREQQEREAEQRKLQEREAERQRLREQQEREGYASKNLMDDHSVGFELNRATELTGKGRMFEAEPSRHCPEHKLITAKKRRSGELCSPPGQDGELEFQRLATAKREIYQELTAKALEEFKRVESSIEEKSTRPAGNQNHFSYEREPATKHKMGTEEKSNARKKKLTEANYHKTKTNTPVLNWQIEHAKNVKNSTECAEIAKLDYEEMQINLVQTRPSVTKEQVTHGKKGFVYNNVYAARMELAAVGIVSDGVIEAQTVVEKKQPVSVGRTENTTNESKLYAKRTHDRIQSLKAAGNCAAERYYAGQNEASDQKQRLQQERETENKHLQHEHETETQRAEKQRLREQQEHEGEKQCLREQQEREAEKQRLRGQQEHEGEKQRLREQQEYEAEKKLRKQQEHEAEKQRLREQQEREAEKQRLIELQQREAEKQRLRKQQEHEGEKQRLREQQEHEAEKQRLIEQQQREDEKQRLRDLQEREAEKQRLRVQREREDEKQRLREQQEHEAKKQRLRKLQERDAEKQHLREQQEHEAERQRLRERQEREAEKQRLREQQEREGAKQRLIEQQQHEAEKQHLREQQEREAEKQRLIEQQQREAEKQHLREQQEREAEKQRLIEQQQREDEKQRFREQQEREAKKQRLIAQQQHEAEKQHLREQQEREAEKQRLIEQQQREAEKQHLREQQEREAEKQRLREQQEREDEKQRLREQQERDEKQHFKEQQEREAKKQRLIAQQQREAEKQHLREQQESEAEKQCFREQEERDEKQRLREQQEHEAEKQHLREQQEREAEKQRLREQQEREAEKQRLREQQERDEKQRLREQQERDEKQRLREQQEREAEKQSLREQQEREAEKQRLREQQESEAEKQHLRKQQERETEKQRLREQQKHKAEMQRLKEQQNLGLRNLGNTCYMNSVLQCLSKADWNQLANVNSDNHFLNRFFEVMDSVAGGSAVDKKGGSNSVDPSNFKNELSQKSKRFGSKDQQDANEFVTFVLDALREGITKEVLLWSSPDARSSFDDRFSGTLQNVTVLDCKPEHDMKTSQTIFTVSLPVKIEQPITIKNCLKRFLRNEKLEDEAYCNICKKLTGCSLQLSFKKLPSILVLHLKKFDFFTHTKLNVNVEYEFEGLEVPDASGKIHVYDLYGICNHYGTLSVGHYTADVRTPGTKSWFNYDDARVTKTTEEDLGRNTSAAYILFYKRRNDIANEDQNDDKMMTNTNTH